MKVLPLVVLTLRLVLVLARESRALLAAEASEVGGEGDRADDDDGVMWRRCQWWRATLGRDFISCFAMFWLSIDSQRVLNGLKSFP